MEIRFITVGVRAGLILIVSFTAINTKREQMLRQNGELEHDHGELEEQGDNVITLKHTL